MRLVTFNGNSVGLVDDEELVQLDSVLAARGWAAESSVSGMRFLIDRGLQREDLDTDGLPRFSVDSVRYGPPVPDPTKIVAAPINYRDHQKEMNQVHTISGLGFFLKAPSSLVGHGGVVQLPYSDRRFDQEGELGVVIGARARHVKQEHALDCVFGYTPLMDITMRGGEDRSTRKSFETFTPTGPYVVTADEIADPTVLDLECSVSGQLRQSANTRDLVWDVAALVAYASSVTTLHPGDVIATGTPAGVGPIEDGDTVVLRIANLPELRVGVADDGAVPSPTLGANSGPVPPPPQPRPDGTSATTGRS